MTEIVATFPSKIVECLSRLLADTYVLYTKTQNFHWNVESVHFYSYHKMFEEQYQQLAEATDVLAERLRALEVPAPASLATFLQLTSLKENHEKIEAAAMVKMLMKDHEQMAVNLNKWFKTAEECGDQVTLDLFIERKTEHDKVAWMLRSAL